MLTQSFGSEESNAESDTLTAVQFDHTGQYLATGDQGGRIVLFSRDEDKPSSKKVRNNNDRRRLHFERITHKSFFFFLSFFLFSMHDIDHIADIFFSLIFVGTKTNRKRIFMASLFSISKS